MGITQKLMRFSKSLFLLIIFCLLAHAESLVDLTNKNTRQAKLAKKSLLLDIAVEKDRFYAVGERGHILVKEKTQDWKQTTNVPTRVTLTGIDFFGNKGWAVGHDAIILHSDDEGETWQQQYLDSDLESPLLDVLFWDDKNGIAVGAYGLALFTNNGGEHWEQRALTPDLDWHLNAIVQTDEHTLIIVGEAGFVAKSVDLGQTWQEFAIPYKGSMFGVVYANDNELLAYGLRGNIFSSKDGGESWSQLINETQDSLFGGVVNENHVILIGAKGRTLIRRPEEEQFSIYKNLVEFDLTAVELVEKNRYLLLGEKGVEAVIIN